jgi:hypothetical protein
MRLIVGTTALVVVLASGVLFAGEEAKPPTEVVEALQFYVGNWSVEGSLGDESFKGKAVFRMPRGKHCHIGTVSYRTKEGRQHFSLICGWDSTTGWCTELGVGADGGVYQLPWRKVSAMVEEGELTETVDGKRGVAKVRLEKKGPNNVVVTCTERKLGDEKRPDLTFVYQRVVKEEAERKAKR